MITADQVLDAAELLAEREDLADSLAPLLAATRIKIQIHTTYEHKTLRGESEIRDSWRDGPDLTVTKPIRKLLTAGIEADIAAIDAKLRTLGVSPPTTASAMPSADAGDAGAHPVNGELL